VTQPVTVITGASSGIGSELARTFAANGHALVLVARREQALTALSDDIVATGRPRPLVLAVDLVRSGAAARIAAALAGHGLVAQYVVNNAGFGLVGRADALDRDDQLAMIDLNVRALVELSLAFVADLEGQRGGILNVASVASFMPGPGSAVYYASKAFVLSFSAALHAELAPRGVRVTALCPGPVPTGFQSRAGMSASETDNFLTRSAGAVALAGYRGLMAGRRVVLVGWPNKVAAFLARLLPSGLVLWAMMQVQGRRYGIDLRDRP
jgi:short-subunit dehydrogenase